MPLVPFIPVINTSAATPVVVLDAEALQIVEKVYFSQAINTKLGNILGNEITSFSQGQLLQKSNFPYASWMKISNSSESNDSCNKRVEQTILKIDVYTLSDKKAYNILDKVYDSLDKKSISVSNRRLMSIERITRTVAEVKIGVWHGQEFYSFMLERDIKRKGLRGVAPNVVGAVVDIYNKSPELQVDLNEFGSGKLKNTNYPYAHIPEYDLNLDTLDTCIAFENFSFTIDVYGLSDIEVDTIGEKIIEHYDSAVLEIDNKQQINLEWLGDGLNEVTTGIWHNSLQFQGTQQQTY